LYRGGSEAGTTLAQSYPSLCYPTLHRAMHHTAKTNNSNAAFDAFHKTVFKMQKV